MNKTEKKSQSNRGGKRGEEVLPLVTDETPPDDFHRKKVEMSFYLGGDYLGEHFAVR